MKLHTLPLLAMFLIPSSAVAQDACEIQRELRKQDYFRGEITCTIGPKTTAAIESFQRDKGLHVDGIPGEDTVRALFGRRAEDNERKSPRVVERRERSDQEEFVTGRCADEIVEDEDQRWRKGAAIKEAIKNWKSQVLKRRDLGLEYSSWEHAEDKVTDKGCIKVGTANWHCTVKARPCRAN